MEPINETTIRRLLERYHEGETSLAEERQLSAYFTQAQLPDDLLPYRALFGFFRAEAAFTPPAVRPQKIRAFGPKVIRLLAPLTAAAAVLILYFALRPPVKPDFICYLDGERIYNREEALQVADQQWALMTAQLQKASAMAEKLEQMTDYTEIIHKYIAK
ncbi:MAG: hypothetical protein FWE30_03945 [Bacteroidales bacterium]|nr:hypothetical protein [Bacteroidales bacterium]